MTARTSVTVRAAAKINLHLGVGRVRDDGFHPLDTVYQAISLYDDVTLSVADQAIVLNLGRVVASGPAAELAADEKLRHAYLGF